MSQLDLGTQQLELERYPQQEESTQLQAWEAADEYLLQQLENVDIGGRPVLIFNDNFGTWPVRCTRIALTASATPT